MRRTALAVAILFLAATSTASVRAESSHEQDIQGAWGATWTFTSSTVPFVQPGSGFSAFHMFHEGGTVSSVDDDSFDSTGVGRWEGLGKRNYKFGIHFFIADEQHPSHVAPLVAEVIASVHYDAAKDRWSGTFKSTIRDRDRNLIAEFAGTVVAARLTL